MPMTTFSIRPVTSRQEAERIAEFLLSEYAFDDTRFTQGEIEQFRRLPYAALDGELLLRYALDEAGEIAGMNCFVQNEQLTGGYNWDYIAVHRQYRKSGLASAFIEDMFSLLRERKARYIVTYTCDLPEYAAIRRLFERNGFSLVGRCPDYYYDGEDRLIYYRKLENL